MSDFNLGTVTAYGYAKDKGYTGTEAEFAELMASYASVAESAAASAESAAASATTATTKAGEASTSASNAATSATTASTAATTATTKAGEASTSASTASTKASEATTAAATATTKAGEASTSATNAAGSATTASTAATTATTKASEAAASATAAAQSAASLVIDDTLTHAGQAADAKKVGDELSDVKDGLTAVESDVTDLKEDYTTILDSAYVTDTASGAIASFPDGADGVPVKSLTVDIEPVQDLHGQDSPFPAGGGKNKANFENVSVPTGADQQVSLGEVSLSAGTYTLSYTLNKTVTSTRNRPSYAINGVTTYCPNDFNTAGRGSWTFTIENDATLLFRWWYHTVSVACVISDFQLEKGSTATNYVPYAESNICPISGHTSAVVTRTGVNLFDKTAITDGYALVSTTGEIEENTNCFVTDYISVKKGVTYYIPNRGTSRACVYNKDKTYVQRVSTDSGSIAWTSPIDGYIRITSNKTVTTADDFQISIGSSAVTYEPYSGQTVTIDLDGTRYGGTLNVETGVLTVDRILGVFNGSEAWSEYTSHEGYSYRPTNMKTGTRQDGVSNMLSDSKISTTGQKNAMWLGVNSNILFVIGVYESMGSTLSDFKSYLSQHNLEVVYPLDTPFTVQLTANEISTLLGQNNIFADTGDTEVEYRADTKLYIEKLTAPTEDDMIADHAISANSFFMVGNTLYRATTAIASGATITVGTNATKMSLSEALNALS